jgi:hypothetical protein
MSLNNNYLIFGVSGHRQICYSLQALSIFLVEVVNPVFFLFVTIFFSNVL